jgi:methanogenic corrinoid protein MtbC1
MDRDDAKRRAGLVRMIEGEIVPRLLMSLAHSGQDAKVSESTPALPESDDVAELARLLLNHDQAIAATFVRILRHHGTPPERICLDLLAPAARRMGEMWEQDDCNFTELAAGLNRLQSVLREVSQEPH